MMHLQNSNITKSREDVLTAACAELAENLQEIEPTDYHLFFAFGEMPDVYDRVCDLLDRHFTQGTFSFACTGETTLNWNEKPVAGIDLEFFNQEIFVFFRLFIVGDRPSVEIHHIVFQESAGNPAQNTAALKLALSAAALTKAADPQSRM